MDLESEFLLYLSANGSDYVGSECRVDLLLVVVNGRLGGVQMLDVDQHVEWVVQCHEEVVQLVQSVLVGCYLLEEDGEQRAVPIQESASGGFSDIPLPVGDDVDHPSVVL